MLKIIWILLVIFFSAVDVQAFSYGKFVSCNSINPMPEIVFKYSYGQLGYDFSKTADELTAAASGEFSEKGIFKAGGLATRPFQWYIKFNKGQVKYIAKDVYCVFPEEMEVFIGYQNPQILLAKEFVNNKFMYAMILRHEQTHQWINKLTLEYFLPLFYKRIVVAAKEVRAVKVYSSSQENLQAGYNEIHDYYMARLKPVVEEFQKILQEEQKKLDNTVNYGEEHQLYRDYLEKKKILNQ